MGLLSKTPEERAAKEARAFEKSPQGHARMAREQGDWVFQVSLPADARALDESTATLNAICAEGWKLISASVAFVQKGQNSYGKAIGSGQYASVAGEITGVYVFRRS